MATSTLLNIVMPSIVGFIMFGIGLSLKSDDFRRVLREPKSVGVGLACQILLLPTIAYGLIHLFSLSPPFAVGMMLLAASPGGSTANLFSHLAGGAVALNVTLTAVSSIVSLLTVPLIAHWTLNHFLSQGQAIDVDSSKLIQTLFVVLVPMAIGMWLAKIRPTIQTRILGPVNKISIVLVLLLIIGSILKEKNNLQAAIQMVGMAIVVFNVLSILVAYLVSRLCRMPEREAIAVSFEVGIHNGTMAIALSANPVIVDTVRAAGFEISDLSVAFPAAVYAIFMNFSGGIMIWLARKRLLRRSGP